MIIDFHAIQLCWRINKIVQRERGAVAYTSVHAVVCYLCCQSGSRFDAGVRCVTYLLAMGWIKAT